LAGDDHMPPRIVPRETIRYGMNTQGGGLIPYIKNGWSDFDGCFPNDPLINPPTLFQANGDGAVGIGGNIDPIGPDCANLFNRQQVGEFLFALAAVALKNVPIALPHI
jgi:hypothetical protein